VKNQEFYQDLAKDNTLALFGLRIYAYYDEAGQLTFRMALDEDEGSAVASTTVVGIMEMAKVNLLMLNTLKQKPRNPEE